MTDRKKRPVLEVSEEARQRLKVVAASRKMTMRELLDEIAATAYQREFPAAAPTPEPRPAEES